MQTLKAYAANGSKEPKIDVLCHVGEGPATGNKEKSELRKNCRDVFCWPWSIKKTVGPDPCAS